jgi:hypothetical protein
MCLFHLLRFLWTFCNLRVMQAPKNTHNQVSNTLSFDTVNEIKYTYLGLTLILLPFFCGMTMKNTASQVSEILLLQIEGV